MSKKKQILSLLILLILGALVLVAGRDNSYKTVGNEIATPPPIKISQTDSEIHKITLPHDEPDFPPGPGREMFLARCTVCHSLRYITMQPDFPKKTWGKEVAKMINTFGAHITGAEAREITEYLSTIKGLEPHPGSKGKE
jgi:sulfite dehydrogenase